jgi:hypothetical protein
VLLRLIFNKVVTFFANERLIPLIGALRRLIDPVGFRLDARTKLTLNEYKRRIQMSRSWELSRVSVALIVVLLVVGAPFLWAQTLGNAPQLNVAVQGQTGAQPEGAFFNFINWIGNVIAPVGAGGAVFAGIIGYVSGRGSGRWLLAAAALLAVSGLTRLLEFWVLQGVGGVS